MIDDGLIFPVILLKSFIVSRRKLMTFVELVSFWITYTKHDHIKNIFLTFKMLLKLCTGNQEAIRLLLKKKYSLKIV